MKSPELEFCQTEINVLLKNKDRRIGIKYECYVTCIIGEQTVNTKLVWATTVNYM